MGALYVPRQGVDTHGPDSRPLDSHTDGYGSVAMMGELKDVPHGTRAKVVDSVRPHVSSIIGTVKRLGYTETEVSQALSSLMETNQDITCDSLIDASYDARTRCYDVNITGAAPCQLNLNEDTAKSELRRHKFEQQLEEALQQKKRDLQEAIEALKYKCHVCGEVEANTVLLPCCHLVSCSDCLMSLRRCPLVKCNKIIRGTKEVFLA